MDSTVNVGAGSSRDVSVGNVTFSLPEEQDKALFTLKASERRERFRKEGVHTESERCCDLYGHVTHPAKAVAL